MEMWAEEDEYESLPESSSVTTHMVAGALAGIMEHCVMYPVDIIKTRMQSIRPSSHSRYRSIGDAFVKISRDEGMFRTLRGMNVVALGAGPAHALYFSCYEQMKVTLSHSNPGKNPLANGAAGCCATLLHDAIMNPAEVIKQRLQMYSSPYKGALDCMWSIWRQEGISAFYRSYTTQLTMNIPFQSIHFITYELMQELLNPGREYNPSTHLVSGALAGGVAGGLTTPLDVCKTLLNTQERCTFSGRRSLTVSGISDAVRTVYHFRGAVGFFGGMRARVVFQMPSTAIAWSVYEFFKFVLAKEGNPRGSAGNEFPVLQTTGSQ